MPLPLRPSKFRPIGPFGAFDTNDICLMGGFRCGGYHRPGHERQKFEILGVPEYNANPDDRSAYVFGFIEVNVDLRGPEPKIADLVVIEIEKSKRKRGYGKRAVSAVLSAAEGDLPIYDIKAVAISFWKKCGAEFEGKSRRKGQTAILPRQPALDATLALEQEMETAPSL